MHAATPDHRCAQPFRLDERHLGGPITAKAAPGWDVSWQSVDTRTYFLERSTNLSAIPAFVSVQSTIFCQAGMTTFADVTATNAGPLFYRVGIQE